MLPCEERRGGAGRQGGRALWRGGGLAGWQGGVVAGWRVGGVFRRLYIYIYICIYIYVCIHIYIYILSVRKCIKHVFVLFDFDLGRPGK